MTPEWHVVQAQKAMDEVYERTMAMNGKRLPHETIMTECAMMQILISTAQVHATLALVRK